MYDIEEFRDIVGFDDLYEVSNEGNVRNKITGKILKPTSNEKGYLRVGLYKDGIRKYRSIHRLVARAFLPNPNSEFEVDHIDKNRTNNNVDNLRWVSHQENIDYSLSKPVAQFSLDGRLLNTYKSINEAERQTGVCQSNIVQCCKGNLGYSHAGNFIWKYV